MRKTCSNSPDSRARAKDVVGDQWEEYENSYEVFIQTREISLKKFSRSVMLSIKIFLNEKQYNLYSLVVF